MLNNSRITNQLKKKRNLYTKHYEKNIITAIKARYRVKHKGTIEKVRRKRINAVNAAITAGNCKANDKVHAYFRNKRNYRNRKQLTSNNSNQMIKANELRIGDYAHSKNDGIIKITNISEKSVTVLQDNFCNNFCNNIPKNLINPIKINQEWLIKFGFKKKGTSFFIIIGSKLELLNVSNKDFVAYFKGSTINIKIKYVHQIQNLYFALTGEELTLKKTKMKKIKLAILARLIRTINVFFNEKSTPNDEANALLRIINLEKDTQYRLETFNIFKAKFTAQMLDEKFKSLKKAELISGQMTRRVEVSDIVVSDPVFLEPIKNLK